MVLKLPSGKTAVRKSAHVKRISPRREVILFEQEADNMVSDWTDQILLSCGARGRFTVLARKHTLKDENRRDRGRRWFSVSKSSNIRMPGVLFQAVEAAKLNLCVPFEWAEALPKLAEIDWAVAAVIAVQQSLPVPPPPATPIAWRKQTAATGARHDLYRMGLPHVRSGASFQDLGERAERKDAHEEIQIPVRR
jgi:hypothetical protein